MTPFSWTADHLALLADARPAAAPEIDAVAVRRFVDDLDLWDHWPVLEIDGTLADFEGRTLIFALSAAVFDDPDRRHDVARLRLFSVAGDDWFDLGPVFADGFTPGSREWAGSAVVHAAHDRLDLYFTATGEAGEPKPSYRQRIVQSQATMSRIDGKLCPVDWTSPVEAIQPDDLWYQRRHDGGAILGTIKAFRDPFVFVDGGSEWMVFTGSSATSDNAWNGVVGLAKHSKDGWTIHPPVVTAVGVNNELERPHVVRRQGRIYLFWSTQAGVFAPGIVGPTGLFGLVAEHLDGPWAPLNGNGLVFPNPDTSPAQAYSWQVLNDLRVWSFADQIALPGRVAHPVPFAGTPAPPLKLWLDGDRAGLAL